jgi:hypothetical protein
MKPRSSCKHRINSEVLLTLYTYYNTNTSEQLKSKGTGCKHLSSIPPRICYTVQKRTLNFSRDAYSDISISCYSTIKMTWHTPTCWRGSEGAREWSGYPPSLAWPRNTASPAQYKHYQVTRTPRLPVVDWTVTPAESHGLVHFAKRRNLVSVRVPSNLNCSILTI